MEIFIDDDDLNKVHVFNKVGEIKIKTSEDKYFCYISSIAMLSATELIVLDVENRSVKLVNTFSNIVTASTSFMEPPSAVTTINTKLFAVLFPVSCTVKFVSTSQAGELSVQESIRLSGKCLGIKYLNDKLYVSFANPAKFEVLSLDGASLNTIYINCDLCKMPRYFTVRSDEKLIYITDPDTNSAFAIDMTGKIKVFYPHFLHNPKDIVMSSAGEVYVCERNNHAVYSMPPNLSKGYRVIGLDEHLQFPHAMCLNQQRNILYISQTGSRHNSHNFITVYKCND
jgi:DNA-binding beta-propeller fold protein YncE